MNNKKKVNNQNNQKVKKVTTDQKVQKVTTDQKVTTITLMEIMNVCVGVKTHLLMLVITLMTVGTKPQMVQITLLTPLQVLGKLLLNGYGVVLMIIVLLMLLMVMIPTTVPTMTPEILLVMVQDSSDLKDRKSVV